MWKRAWRGAVARVVVAAMLVGTVAVVVEPSPPAAHATHPGDNGLILYGGAPVDGGTAGFTTLDPADGTTEVLPILEETSTYDGVSRASWSPDGSRLAFYAYDPATGRAWIWLADPDGTNLSRVPGTEGADEAYPVAWSPDGARLAFGLYSRNVHSIWTVGVDGSGLTEVFNPQDEWPREPWQNQGSALAPDWSPDGDEILFRGGPYDSSVPRYRSQLWRVGVDGSGLTQIGTVDYVSYASWSPNGAEVAFIAPRDFSSNAAVIQTIRADGTGLRTLQTLDYRPSLSGLVWSPDGESLAYLQNGVSVHLVRVANGVDTVTELVGTTSAHWLSWQPLPDICALAEAGPGVRGRVAAEAGPVAPPVVGPWGFGGSWRKVGDTVWETSCQVKVNGLVMTPEAGAKIVVDTSAPALRTVGAVSVATPAFSIGGQSFAGLTLFQGALDWPLTGSALPVQLQDGLRVVGLRTQPSSAAITPEAGWVTIGPINMLLPELIGGVGSLTLRVGPPGVDVSSFRIGPITRTVGGLLPVQDLVLAATADGWGVTGSVVIPGSPGSTLGGLVVYNPAGDLVGANVTAGNLKLFGGVLPVESLAFTWSAATGWRAQAAAPVPGQPDGSVRVTLGYGANGALTTGDLFVTRTALGGVAQLNNLDLSYVAQNQQWSGRASVTVGGPAGTTVEGTFAMRAGQFVSGSIDVTNPTGVPLGPLVRLTRLGAGIGVDPWRWAGAVGIGAGQLIEGKPAVRIEGSGRYRYPAAPLPGLWHVDANVALTDFQLLSGWLEYNSNGRTEFGGQLGAGGGFNFAGVTLSAALTGWVDPQAGYSAEGNASLNVNGMDITGRAVVSSKGVAACGGVRSGWSWEAGFGYLWSTNQITILANSCDLRPWEGQAAPAVAAGAAEASSTFTVPAGVPVHGVQFTGTTAPPRVTLSGPAGESYGTPANPADLGVQGDDYLVVQDTARKTTTFLIDTPTAGTWRATTAAGSVPVAAMAAAQWLPDPQITATVTGSGASRTLSWNLTPLAGQTVTFAERGADSTATITTTSAATGQVVFTPAAGAAGTREIVAVVEQDGMPRDEIVVGSYAAPAGATVSVARTGTGTGTVTSPAGIACGATCAASVAPGTQVTLSAAPAAGSTFAGWSGPCEGTGSCTFTVGESTTVGAGFVAQNQPSTAPAMSKPSKAAQKKNTFAVAWGGATDPDGAVAGYDVRSRHAGLDGAFGGYTAWQTATAATSATFAGDAATTYCFSARAVDDDGATSAWSAERCTATPLDDRALTASGGFVRRTGTGNIEGTYSEATRTGAYLASPPLTGRTVSVVVHRCPTCGTAKVRFAGQVLGTVDLRAATTQRKHVVTYELPATATGSVKVSVTSSGRPVRIDAIAVTARPG